jgi:thioesterase domain-containing protein
MSPPRHLRSLGAGEVLFFARRGHKPGVPYPGEVALFRATQGTGVIDDAPSIELYEDPLLGWGKRVSGKLAVIEVPGGHSSMLQEPNVQVLALRMSLLLAPRIRQAEEREAAEAPAEKGAAGRTLAKLEIPQA